MFDYELHVHEEQGSVWLSCPTIPELHAAGESLEQALSTVNSAVDTALSLYVERRQKIPYGHWLLEGVVLRLSALSSAKVALWNTLLDSGVSKAELARRLDIQRPQVDRLLDFLHDSKISNVERALHLFGYRLSLTLEPLESE